jgi:pyridoxal phosphate enzyme (YggS family)
MSPISERLQAILSRMGDAARQAGRTPESVRLVAVSKSQPATVLRLAHVAGQSAFGENYLQEALGKMVELADLPLEWHFIGPIQSNKTRLIAEHFDWVHSIDRLKIAQRLNDARPHNLPPLNVCIEVNISHEASKSGVAPAEVSALATAITQLPRLRFRGLMAIPEPCNDVVQQRANFAGLRALKEQLQQQGLELDTLSMGMTHDFEAAILEGATLVRIGTAIFGPRLSRTPQ